jgi:hypothetical protein
MRCLSGLPTSCHCQDCEPFLTYLGNRVRSQVLDQPTATRGSFRVPQRHVRVSIAVGALRGARSRACLTRCARPGRCYARSQLIWRAAASFLTVGVGDGSTFVARIGGACASAGSLCLACPVRCAYAGWVIVPPPRSGARRSGAAPGASMIRQKSPVVCASRA